MSAVTQIRVLQLNDVYKFENMSRYATAVRELSEGREHVVKVLAGDFLAPSVLSKLDSGIAMVQVLNKVGIEYVCFGNHENDVPYNEMLKRITESNFKWINSNMDMNLGEKVPALPWAVDGKLPAYEILEFGDKKVALLGLLTGDPSLYPKTRFHGAEIAPIIDSAERLYNELREKVDMVLPMTHQGVEEDRLFMKHFGDKFPLVMGGHDHTVFHEIVNGSTLLKVGMDADRIGVIDITLGSGAPEVDVQLVETKNYAADEEVAALVKKHFAILDKFDEAILFNTQDNELSSKSIRLQPVSLATFLISATRDAYFADCAMLNAGCIRGATDYASFTDFTYTNLRREIPFDSQSLCLQLSGGTISDALHFSRTERYNTGGYLQTCDGLTVVDNRVTHVKGEPLDRERMYSVVLLYSAAMEKMDNIEPIVKALEDGQIKPCHDAARDLKDVLVSRFARVRWCRAMGEMHFTFDNMDTNRDGSISFEEFARAAGSSDRPFSDVVLKNVWNILDEDNNNAVTKAELLTFLLPISATDKHTLKKEEAVPIIQRVFGPDNTDDVYSSLGKFFNAQGDIDLHKMLTDYIPIADTQIVH
eukprot:TRINITY_DN8089_c0_g1_i3.p1 TRINITY_DN8089_c0_g1~~TRINITY_DN8089_c0_g1_i3.p1  ORF type:complete len:591 (+),score=233.91 TRINITY_DN8089_c0_g1_i3:50-1822(+)